MRLLLTWTRRVVMLIVLTGSVAAPVEAETTISTSNATDGGLGGQMSALLMQERAAIGQLASGKFEQILAAPRQPAAAQATAVAAVVPEVQPAAAVKPVAAAKFVPFWVQAEPVTPAIPAVLAVQYDPGWLAGLPAATGDDQWQCLAKALYFEARGESVKGQFAVAEVVLNRVDSGLYPHSICGVINQGTRYSCQFSFVCDGNSDKIRERGAYEQVAKVARLMIDGAPRALTAGATHFRTGAVMPSWARRFTQTAKIGAHYFHRQPMRVASN